MKKVNTMGNKTTYIIGAGLLAMIMVSGTAINGAHAESSSTNASVTVANTISLTLTGGDLVIDNLTPGNASDSNVITANVTSNSPYGINLSATTGTAGGTTSLVNTADSNFTFINLNTNKATLSNFSDNTWGYSYSTDNGSTWVSGDYGSATAGYNGLPLDADDDGESGTTLYHIDSYAGSSSVKFKIGAKSATTQAAGTYTNIVNFYAVTNPEPPKTIATATTMQEVAPGTTGCPSTLTTGQVYTLKDSRDDTEYHVARLANGKCWLLDNLALDLTNSTVLNGMSSSNTNASDATLGYLKNGGGTTSDKYAITGVVNWTDSPTYASTFSYSDPLVNLTNKDVVPADAISQAGQYKVGGYYNYCAASAGSYCYGDGGASFGTPSGDATEDICPKGWRMPHGRTNGEYSALAQAIYGSTDYTSDATAYANYRSALHLPLSGDFYSGSPSGQGIYGDWWSSDNSYYNLMYNLYVYTDRIYPASNYDRRNGYSVRCILGS